MNIISDKDQIGNKKHMHEHPGAVYELRKVGQVVINGKLSMESYIPSILH